MNPTQIYAEFFPQFTPSCFQQDLLESAVTDLKLWRETLTFWAGNGYRPQSIQKMISYYDELQMKRAKNGSQLPTIADKLADDIANRMHIVAPPSRVYAELEAEFIK